MPLFLRTLKTYYKKHNRGSLPWRGTTNAYKILVSEVMLQQTQVERVIPKYKSFLKQFPSVRALGEASLAEVLGQWQGLGYNRRGKFLHEAAKMLLEKHKGIVPRDPILIEGLPGVGHYTARAVAAFAYNQPEVFIETNIRTVFMYHFHSSLLQKTGIRDEEILLLVEEALKKSKMEPRDFYAALMDYGAHLKQSGVRINHKSKHYTKQSKFEGSTRQKRAQYLRALLRRGASETELRKALS